MDLRVFGTVFKSCVVMLRLRVWCWLSLTCMRWWLCSMVVSCEWDEVAVLFCAVAVVPFLWLGCVCYLPCDRDLSGSLERGFIFGSECESRVFWVFILATREGKNSRFLTLPCWKPQSVFEQCLCRSLCERNKRCCVGTSAWESNTGGHSWSVERCRWPSLYSLSIPVL